MMSSLKKRLLITGGCGFLGSNLAAEALRRGWELMILDNLSRTGAKENRAWLSSQGSYQFCQADVRDAELIDVMVQAFAPEIVFHLAGQVAMTSSIKDPRNDFEINTLGTLNVLEAIRKHAPEATVTYSSTNKVYGDLETLSYNETKTRWQATHYVDGFTESLPLDFRSPYGCSKGAADQYMLDYHRVYGLKTIVFRHSSMYGGRQYATIDQGWVGWFCEQAWAQKRGNKTPFTICGDGKQVRDLLHADDMIRLYFSAAESGPEVAGHAFNIGGGMPQSKSLLELFEFLQVSLDVKLRWNHLPARSSDQRVFVADCRKVSAMLGWRPQVTVADGLSRMLDWTNQYAA